MIVRYLKYLIIPLLFLFSGSCSVFDPTPDYAGNNTGNPMVKTRHINRAERPGHSHNRYLDSNRKKKKVWTKIKQIPSYDCPWDKGYYSTSEKKIKRRLEKVRRISR